jgi:hypothetical protein
MNVIVWNIFGCSEHSTAYFRGSGKDYYPRSDPQHPKPPQQQQAFRQNQEKGTLTARLLSLVRKVYCIRQKASPLREFVIDCGISGASNGA